MELTVCSIDVTIKSRRRTTARNNNVQNETDDRYRDGQERDRFVHRRNVIRR